MITLTTLAALALGYCIGVMQGGINIYTGSRSKKEDKKEPVYNPTPEMPPEVEQYFNQTQGHIK